MSTLSSSELTTSLDNYQIVTPEDMRACLAQPSGTVDTPSGPIEYGLRGEGPPVLVCHGGPGGYDQALLLGELFRKNGFRIIAPSRPGYLGTQVDQGRTAEEQGDFMARVLDALGVDRAIVVGVSGGGPAAYQMAQRHPDRTVALLVIDGIAMHYTKADDVTAFEKWMYLSKPGQWLTGFFFRHFPEATVKSFLQTESTLERHELGERAREIMNDENKFALFDAMFQTMSRRFDERLVGAENDIALGAAIDRLPLGNIACPTLIIHGDADDDVPPRDAEYAHGAIAGSQLLWIDRASHIGFWTSGDAAVVQGYALDWMLKAGGEA